MSEAKFTKGPWEYRLSDNLQGYSIAPENTLPTLACVERCEGDKIHIECYNFPGSTEANARLIATAPELVEGLQEAKTAIENMTKVKCFHSGSIPCQCSLCKINRVLDKALNQS